MTLHNFLPTLLFVFSLSALILVMISKLLNLFYKNG